MKWRSWMSCGKSLEAQWFDKWWDLTLWLAPYKVGRCYPSQHQPFQSTNLIHNKDLQAFPWVDDGKSLIFREKICTIICFTRENSKVNCGTNISMFILNFPLQNRGIIVFSHYQTNHFMFAYQKFKFFLMVPKGILKKFVVIVPAYYGLVQGKVKEIQVFLNGPIGNL